MMMIISPKKIKDFAYKFVEIGVNPLPSTISLKRPKLPGWKIYQERIITKEEIENYFNSEVNAIGVVTGKVSGNLEIMDFDNKFGNIDDVFNEFITIPEVKEIIDRCIVEKSQSGGYHLIYRAEEIGANQSLASLMNQEKIPEKIIETRGEGGFCLVYPSNKYILISGSWEKIPLLTVEERNTLLSFARSFNKVMKKVEYSEESLSLTKYEELPGNAYNNNIEGISEAKRLLIEHGWCLVRTFKEVEYWRRPNAKTRNIDATFRKSVFYIFTSNSHPFESEKGYSPFSILITLKFAGNVKDAVRYLIEKGYGKKKVIRESSKHTEVVSAVFYEIKYRRKSEYLEINKVNFMYYLKKNGFFKYYDANNYKIIKITHNIVEEITIPQIKDYIMDYINGLEVPIIGNYTKYDLMAVIMDDSKKIFTKHLIEFLEVIELDIMRDTKEDSHFFFNNCWVRVNRDAMVVLSYTKLPGKIWRGQKQERNYNEPDTDSASIFERFIRNICRDDNERIDALETSIGYLLHSYKDPNNAKAIIFCDQGDATQSSDESNGRSGKSLVGKAIGKLRKEVRIDARNFAIDKTFAFQQVGYDTQLINFNDVDKRFNFEKLFSIITDAITIEKKNQPEFSIPFEQSPKILISTNYAIQIDGTSGEDRKWEIEFSDFYNKTHRPIDDFSHRFFDEWNDEEWNNFYHYMMCCTQKYLCNGLMRYSYKNLSRRILLQVTNIDFLDYMEDNQYNKYYISIHYKKFIDIYPQYSSKITNNTFGKWLKKYLNVTGIRWKSGRDSEGRFYELY